MARSTSATACLGYSSFCARRQSVRFKCRGWRRLRGLLAPHCAITKALFDRKPLLCASLTGAQLSFRATNQLAVAREHVVNAFRLSMFRKELKVKSRANAKSSERKKYRALIQALYDLPEREVERLLPAKGGSLEVGILMVPHCPVDGRVDVNITVYYVNKEPLFFEYNRQWYPTVYCLWNNPGLIPMITTWPGVLAKLIGGADLMLPGVVGVSEGGACYASLQKGQVCAVNLLRNRCPVAVGITLMSGREMVSQGMRGKGVVILHTHRDCLWESGSKTDLPVIPFPVPIHDSKVDEDRSCAEKSGGDLGQNPVAESQSGNEDGKDGSWSDCQALEGAVALDNVPTESSDREERVEGVEEEEGEEEEEGVSMDSLLLHCFVCGVRGRLRKDHLPLLTSNFYRTCILPECPPGYKLDIKKTTHKKLSSFLEAMSGEGVLKVEEVSTGVDAVTSVELRHPIVRHYVPPDGLTHAITEEGSTAERGMPLPGPAHHGEEKLAIQEMFMPSAASLPVFHGQGHSKSSLLKPSQVREALTEYVKSQQLVSAEDRRKVQLDATLRSLFHRKGRDDPEQLTWNELMTQFMENLRPAYQVALPGGEVQVRKGKPPPIKLTVVQRSGNKKATLVDNLEIYGIDPDKFASDLQKMAATSASVINSSVHPGEKQVFVQGNVAKVVTRTLLETFGVPSKYLLEDNKTQKTAKKRGR